MKFIAALGTVIVGLVIAIFVSFLVAWPFMIAMGNLHAFMASVPAAGFFDVWSVTVWLSLGVSLMRVDWNE